MKNESDLNETYRMFNSVPDEIGTINNLLSEINKRFWVTSLDSTRNRYFSSLENILIFIKRNLEKTRLHFIRDHRDREKIHGHLLSILTCGQEKGLITEIYAGENLLGIPIFDFEFAIIAMNRNQNAWIALAKQR